jgi:hypothetical protein
MSTTIGCPIPDASQPKEPVRLIEANSILRLIDTNGSAYDGIEYQAYKAGAEYVRSLIEDAPTIDPESLRLTAKWIEAPDEGADGSWEACSRCAKESRWAASKYKYCPHCGARMVNEDE